MSRPRLSSPAIAKAAYDTPSLNFVELRYHLNIPQKTYYNNDNRAFPRFANRLSPRGRSLDRQKFHASVPWRRTTAALPWKLGAKRTTVGVTKRQRKSIKKKGYGNKIRSCERHLLQYYHNDTHGRRDRRSGPSFVHTHPPHPHGAFLTFRASCYTCSRVVGSNDNFHVHSNKHSRTHRYTITFFVHSNNKDWGRGGEGGGGGNSSVNRESSATSGRVSC